MDTTKSVSAGSRPVGAAETSKGDHESLKGHGKVASKSTLQDHHADEQAPEGKYMTHIKDDKADVTPIADG